MTAYNIPKRIRVEIVGITDVYSFKDKRLIYWVIGQE